MANQWLHNNLYWCVSIVIVLASGHQHWAQLDLSPTNASMNYSIICKSWFLWTAPSCDQCISCILSIVQNKLKNKCGCTWQLLYHTGTWLVKMFIVPSLLPVLKVSPKGAAGEQVCNNSTCKINAVNWLECHRSNSFFHSKWRVLAICRQSKIDQQQIQGSLALCYSLNVHFVIAS